MQLERNSWPLPSRIQSNLLLIICVFLCSFLPLTSRCFQRIHVGGSYCDFSRCYERVQALRISRYCPIRTSLILRRCGDNDERVVRAVPLEIHLVALQASEMAQDGRICVLPVGNVQAFVVVSGSKKRSFMEHISEHYSTESRQLITLLIKLLISKSRMIS